MRADDDAVTDECPELPRTHALADGELPHREAAWARAHVAGCAQCRAELVFLMQLAIAVARGVAAIEEQEMAALGAMAMIGPIGRPS